MLLLCLAISLYLRRIFGPMFTAPITHIPGICHFIGFLTLEIHPPERTMGPLDTPCWGTFGEFQPIQNLVIGGSTSHCARKYMNYRSNVRIHNPPKTNCNPFRLGLHSNLWWKKKSREASACWSPAGAVLWAPQARELRGSPPRVRDTKVGCI